MPPSKSRASIDIGERLRTARMARGLSQRQLARRAGVANGLISQIEQNHSSPSVASLKRIIDVLPLSLAEFFADDFVLRRQYFVRAADLPEIDVQRAFRGLGLSGGIGLRLAGANAGGTLQVLQVRYEPGADTGVLKYERKGDQVGLVISGRIEATVGDETSELGPGDAFQFDASIPHRFRNLGEETCILVSASTSPTFHGRLSI